ncbi:MAG: hypothetical protein GF398_15585 [Chitinivibrionales bacterium]|nr:hypothetical protein [Chitinivibrionales bacterium]
MRAITTVFLLLPACVIAKAGQSKPIIAVLNLKNTSGIKDGEADVLSDRFRNELFNTRLVQVMERDQMQAILKEQGFQHSGVCSDEGCMVEMGQVLGVQKIVTGSIGKLGSLYMMNIRQVSVATGKIEKVVSKDIKGDIEDVVAMLSVIAWELTAGKAPEDVQKVAFEVSESDKSESEMEVIKNGKIYLVMASFAEQELGFSLSRDNLEEIDEDLQDAFNEIFDEEVLLAPQNRLAEVAGDNVLIIRYRMNAYVTEPAPRNQQHGIADVTFSFFTGPTSPEPRYSVRIKEKGDRHWGDETPFENAFEEIAETIEDDLDNNEFIRKFNRGKIERP